jgi:hypothetical protein
MTASHALDARPSARPRAHGIDLVVMRMSLAGLRWARRRANRSAASRDALASSRATARATELREHEHAARLHRLPY